MEQSFDLDTPLMNFSGQKSNSSFTIRDAVENICMFGGIGAGKTSGSLRTIIKKTFSAGFGGVVLTVKRSERLLIETYARETNRSDDLIIVSPSSGQSFDFLTYLASCDGEVSYIQNVVSILKIIIEANQEKSQGKSNDPFWDHALTMALQNTLNLCLLAYGKLSVRQIYDVFSAAPKEGQKREAGQKPDSFTQAFEAAQANISAQVSAYIDGLSLADKERIKDPEVFERIVLDGVPDAMRLKSIDQFFIGSYRVLASKTRSIVDFSFAGFLFSLLQEPIYSIFCKHPSTFVPEDCLRGRILLIDLPVNVYGEAGRDVQTLIKLIFQKAMLRRDISKDGGRPLFLIADEAQNFIHPFDADWLATTREYRISAIYASQNMPNYFANMGGDSHKSEYKVKALLAVFGTKFFHANSCMDTNRFAADLMGKGYTEDESRGTTVSGDFSASRNISLVLEDMVRPEMFGHLRTGGPGNDYLVEAYVHRQGKLFDNGHNFKKIIFKQKN